MADAILFAVARKLGDMAKEKVVNNYVLLEGVQQEAQSLRNKLGVIKEGLQKAELEQTEDMHVKWWMNSLKQIKYDTEDVLDEWDTRDAIFESEASDFSKKLFSLSSKYCSCFEPFLLILFGNNFQLLFGRIEIARKMQGITARLETFRRDMEPILTTTQGDSHPPPRQKTSPRSAVSKVYGRDDDKKIIVDWLLSESSEQQNGVPVISIVGTGGFGKTTLARLVLKDEDVMAAFGRNIWWVVSKPFDRERLAGEIVEQATGTKPAAGAWHKYLSESVRGKRFLLLLDDVWSKDESDWKDLKIALAYGEQGSRIVITTHDLEVAKMMGCTSRTHELEPLSPDACWSLFRSIAFLEKSQDEIARLEGIREKITKICGGVPLVAEALASNMRNQRVSDWKAVLTNKVWKVQHEHFFPGLLLSYHALPSSLKQCFVYCSVFRKGTKMKKDQLVKLWMAQGFMESHEIEEQEMEGAEYFDNLAMASFFQDIERHGGDNRIVSGKMHDLVHDFAHFLSGKESCVVTSVNPLEEAYIEQVRHMNVEGEYSSIYKAKNLRTLIAQGEYGGISKFSLLRSLVLSRYAYEKLPSRVGHLLLLRYLDLSKSNNLKELPDTLCNLYNLQTLILYKNRNLGRLPKKIGKLSNLKHLDIRKTDKLRCIPEGIGKLSALRTLSNFKVSGATMGEGCKTGELGSLNHLSGTLELSGLDHVDVDEAESAMLQKKENLRYLELDFGDVSSENEEGMKRQEDVLKALQPSGYLARLAITGYQGSKFPIWMTGIYPDWKNIEPLLRYLVKIKLNNCMNCRELPPLGILEHLEKLHIRKLKSVKRITSEFYNARGATSFPMLKKLVLQEMDELEAWEIPFSESPKVMPCLFSLELSSCPKLMKLPALGRLESLENISFEELDAVKRLGTEFMGALCLGGEEKTLFPKFRKLDFLKMPKWEEWDLPSPLCSLRNLSIVGCPMLKTLSAALSNLQSLESLRVSEMDGVKNVGVDILGISDGYAVIAATGVGESLATSSSSSSDQVLFPNLKDLSLGSLSEWEEDEDIEITTSKLFPGLQKLEIKDCHKLKMVPHYMVSRSLTKLTLKNCPQLKGIQPCHPPPLEELNFEGDIGVLSNSLLPVTAKGNNNDDNSYPNLKSVQILESPKSSLPQGINKFTSLVDLKIDKCGLLELKPKELRYFPMLQELSISKCPHIKREDWGGHLSDQIPFKASFLGDSEPDLSITLTKVK